MSHRFYNALGNQQAGGYGAPQSFNEKRAIYPRLVHPNVRHKIIIKSVWSQALEIQLQTSKIRLSDYPCRYMVRGVY